MNALSTLVHRRVRAALKPFIDHRNDWTFHYPVYLNTFCFTYDLASLLSAGAGEPGTDALGGNFRRHDWWRGLPEFTYRRDIEIFVAVAGMIGDAKNEGHDIQSQHVVRFTRYDVKRVFVRKRSPSAAKKWLLVTDVPQAAQQLVEAWTLKRPPWLRQFGSIQLTLNDIRLSFRRELHDLFADDGKIYLFSAPMAYVLRQQSARNDPRDKYIEERAGMKPIDTFFVFRCNSGVNPEIVRQLRTAITHYYHLIFNARQPWHYLHPKLALEYGRIATTVGQPQPFPEIHQLRPMVTRKHSSRPDLIKRYAQILLDHHHT
jgi:hypothetical protein